MSQSVIYMDHAATTPLKKEVLDAMLPYFSEQFGNPSALYSVGRAAKKAVETARRQIADAIGAESSDEIIFTSGGSESDNLAIKGVASVCAKQNKRHLITTQIEHHAVLRTMDFLERQGFSVTRLPVEPNGILSPQALENALKYCPDTALVSVMYANNEVGTIQPIARLSEICRARKVILHTDAVGAVGQLPISVQKEGIDLLSLSGHKFGAPKGVGVLYVRRGIPFEPLIHGGKQENGSRAGTENVPSIVGLGRAITLACESIPEKAQKISALRDRLLNGLLAIPQTTLNGSRECRLPGNINLCFAGLEGESLLSMLDMQGICASAGSACNAGFAQASHVLLALGIPNELAVGSLRLTLGEENTEQEIEQVLQILPETVARLRRLSPDWEK